MAPRGPTAAAAMAALVLVVAACGSSHASPDVTYDGSSTRAAATADPNARISDPGSSAAAVGSPESRFEFNLADNRGEVAVYRSHLDARNGLAAAKTLAKLFRQDLSGLASVHGNVVIGFDKSPTSEERDEVEGWLRSG